MEAKLLSFIEMASHVDDSISVSNTVIISRIRCRARRDGVSKYVKTTDTILKHAVWLFKVLENSQHSR